MIIDPVILALFAGATFTLTITPGPVVSLMIAESLTYGPRSALYALAGVEVVAIIQLTIYVTSFSYLIAAMPPSAFDIIRYAGVAMLLWMALGMFRQALPAADGDNIYPRKSAKKAFIQGFLVNGANPKGILFLVAFFPQFVDKAQPLAPQLILLSAIFFMIGVSTDLFWIFAAQRARGWLHNKGGIRLVNRIAGIALVMGATLLLLINN
jgi:homoserine/homoserine lactone efflux protein